jgi:hypothetical protein
VLICNQADSLSGQSGHGDVFLSELDRILSALKREIRANSTEIHNDELPYAGLKPRPPKEKDFSRNLQSQLQN